MSFSICAIRAGSGSGPATAASGLRKRRINHHTRARPAAIAMKGISQPSRLKPSEGGFSNTRWPYSSTNAARILESDSPALTMLTTVVSVGHGRQVTVDAGLKALYKDGGHPRVLNPEFPNLQYDWFGDEYGRITYSDPGAAPALGTVLELIPSHCDPTINLFDRFHLVREDSMIGEWPIDLRGCSQ